MPVSPRRRSRITISRLHTCASSGINQVIVLAPIVLRDPRPFQFVRPDFLHDRTPEFVRRGHVDTFLLSFTFGYDVY